jgi:beta-N-acetylhexosaminidase
MRESAHQTAHYMKFSNEGHMTFLSTIRSAPIVKRIIWGMRPEEYSDEKLRELLYVLNPIGIFMQGTYSADSLKIQILRVRALSKEPLLIAIDQEGGGVRHVIDDTNPGAPELSTLPDEQQCQYLRTTDSMLANAGVDINFGLIVDSSSHPSDVMKKRAYSSDPNEVKKYVKRYMRCTGRIKQTAKHFPGIGGTDIDSHTEVPVFSTSFSLWSDTIATPFSEAIRLHVPMIMMGHIIYSAVDTTPASLSSHWIKTIRSTGYNGILITDDLGMLGKNPGELAARTKQALEAGNDLVLISSLPGFEIIPAYEAISSMNAHVISL